MVWEDVCLHWVIMKGCSNYMLRSYAGLFWNDSFNDIEQAVSHLSAIQSMELSENDKVMFDLCTARILLSMGKLSEALERYDICFQNYDFAQYEDYYSMKKNKMLLLEILPACFDNERYLDGMRFGLKIWGRIRNHGWLEECYCSAWIALNYLMLGDVEAAERFLYHAQACNNTMTDTRSQWMEMQLTSVEAFLHFEKEEYEEALETKRKVLVHARECNDAWIQGDTCFEILIILLIFSRETDLYFDTKQEDSNGLVDELREISDLSGLPHLKCKYLMIKAVQAAYEGNQNGISLVEEAKKHSNHYRLASMDPVQMLYIEYRVLSALNARGGNLSRTIGRVIALDRNETYLNKAEHVDSVQYICCDLDGEPLPDTINNIDAIVCFETLEHLQKPEAAIRAFFECLSDDGYLLLSVPNDRHELLDDEGKNKDPFHLHIFSPDTVKIFLDEAGFVIEEVMGQDICNRIVARLSEMKKAGEILQGVMEKLWEYDKENIELFARIFGKPEPINVEQSYSFIYICRKSRAR